MTDQQKHDRKARNDDAADDVAPSQGTAALQEQVKKLTEMAGRAQAELQNAKIRMEREAKDMRQFALASFLLQLLPTIDNFRRAFQHLPKDLQQHEWVKGITAIEDDLMKRVQDAGLTRMECIGQPVDPERHEVLLEAPGEKGIILDVLEDGYELHGKVLRPAKVKAGNGQ